MSRTVVVGIAGGSAAGKSTLARAIAEALESADRRTAVLSSDAYLDRDNQSGPVFISGATGETEFDCNHPDSIDWNRFQQDVSKILQSEHRPEVLLIEGLMIFHVGQVRDIFDIRIFVDLDADERALRRLLRDMGNPRGAQEPAAIAQYYLDSARAGHTRFVEPSRTHADVIVRGDGSPDRQHPLLLAMIYDVIARVGDDQFRSDCPPCARV